MLSRICSPKWAAHFVSLLPGTQGWRWGGGGGAEVGRRISRENSLPPQPWPAPSPRPSPPNRLRSELVKVEHFRRKRFGGEGAITAQFRAAQPHSQGFAPLIENATFAPLILFFC